jgi:hypothetical protein
MTDNKKQTEHSLIFIREKETKNTVRPCEEAGKRISVTLLPCSCHFSPQHKAAEDSLVKGGLSRQKARQIVEQLMGGV